MKLKDNVISIFKLSSYLSKDIKWCPYMRNKDSSC
jgi:hypothetical protein